jgi:hypothetical protein
VKHNSEKGKAIERKQGKRKEQEKPRIKDLRFTTKQNILENHCARSERNIYALGLYSAFLACRAMVFNSSLQSIFTVETIF